MLLWLPKQDATAMMKPQWVAASPPSALTKEYFLVKSSDAARGLLMSYLNIWLTNTLVTRIKVITNLCVKFKVIMTSVRGPHKSRGGLKLAKKDSLEQIKTRINLERWSIALQKIKNC